MLRIDRAPSSKTRIFREFPSWQFTRCSRPTLSHTVVRTAWFLLFYLCLVSLPAQAADPAPPTLYALIVGGGPDVESNAAQIEGHVHFITSLLPAATKHIVLFADGKNDGQTVSYADPSPSADAQRALAILLRDNDAAEPILTRAPELDILVDGPSRLANFRHSLAKICAQATHQPSPLLLYFAGHGSQDEKNEQDTAYDMWDSDALKVRAFADEVANIPRNVPVVLVMAQCFSGAFADLLFRHGDPKGAYIEGNFAGFFSAKKDREAAGCSYETNQDDYQDFSSYFFGALSGHDRFGHPVEGADYNGDGTVTLHEAFCYALIHDPSADTPVCTSDIFLQRFAPLPDATIYGTPYHEAWQAATPAQRAVLDALSQQLSLGGEGRALAVYDRLTFSDPIARPALIQAQEDAKEKLSTLRQKALEPFLKRWPALRWDQSPHQDKSFAGAAKEMKTDPTNAHFLLEAEKSHERADEAVENEEAVLQRFAGLYEHIVEARDLRAHGKEEAKTRFEILCTNEDSRLPINTAR